MTPEEFAQIKGVSARTVQRWLKNGEIPGAVRRRDNTWHLPADAQRVERLDDTPGDASRHDAATPPDATTSRRDVATTPGSDVLPFLPAQGLSLADALAMQPAWLDLDTACRFLGVSKRAVKRDPEFFGARPLGDFRRLLIPQATVRRDAGL